MFKNSGKYIFYIKIIHTINLIYSSEILPLNPHKRFSQYVYDSWQSKNGIPQNTIHTVLQTHDGYIWIGMGRTGLNCLKEGICYTITKKDGLIDNEIFPVYQSANKDIWAGSSKGLTLIKNGKFKNYTT